MVLESVQKELSELRLRMHRTRNVVLPVVGAGLSMPALPSWSKLLQDLIGKVRDEGDRARLLADLAKDKFLDVADEVGDLLGRDEITNHIAATFQAPKASRPKIYDAVAKLPVDHFATTNFDPWLVQAATERERSNLRVLVPWHAPALGDLSVTALPFVFMLHGDARTPQECVLTLDSYQRLQHGSQVYLPLLSALASQRSLLFLGYSLADPDLLMTLDKWQVQLGGPAARHVLLATDVSEHERRRLAKRGVRVVEYAKGRDYAALQGVLEWLGTRPPELDAMPAECDAGKYLQGLLSEVQHVELRGIGAGRTVRTANLVPIERLYTALRTNAFEGRRVAADGAAAIVEDLALLRGSEVPLTDVVLEHERLLVEGQPGSGKTTLLRFVCSLLARDRLAIPGPDGLSWRERHLGSSAAEIDLLPVFVRASELVDRLRNTDGEARAGLLLDHLSARWNEATYGVSRAFWERELREGRAILFVDGLDEIADEALRERMFAVFRDACAWKCRIVVTSRPIATDELLALGFERAVVEPFDRGAIGAFLDLWVRALYEAEPDAALLRQQEHYLAQLREAILDRPRIRRLAQNPVMLTCLAVVHWNEGNLPEGKSRVYKAVLKWLVASRTELRRKNGYADRFAESAFARLALAMTTSTEGKRAVVDLQFAAEAVEPDVARHFPGVTASGERHSFARDWLRFEAIYSGVIVELGEDQLRFWHLTFQEYLAAAQLASLGDDEEDRALPGENWWPISRGHLFDAQWRETVEMLPCCLLDEGGERRVDRLLERVEALRGELPNLAQEALVGAVIGRLLRPLRVLGYEPTTELERLHLDAMHRALAIFDLEGCRQVRWQTRIEVAEEIGRGGDPRIKPGLASFLPVRIAQGLRLGRFPVTVQEYQEFFDDGGYRDATWWGGANGEPWRVRRQNGWSEPGGWVRQIDHPTRPVTGVSWFEADAYCKWMSERYEGEGVECRLPIEDEWVAAVKPVCGQYPWGADQPDAERANLNGWVGSPSAVGAYPAGAGPHGHLDLAGNVWEWGADEYVPSPADRERLTAR